MLPHNCSKKKKHEYRIHEKLSNGQYLNLYFGKHCHHSGMHVWTVGLFISENIREANRFWVGKKVRIRTTGKCGLEGLRKALNYICEFADNLKSNEEIHVGWEDDKRKYAYRYLLKYKFYVDEDEGFYHSRNLKYWKPNDSVVSKLKGDAK